MSGGRQQPARRVRVYTRRGDDGTTGLLYGGRLSKADLVVEAYGCTDEAVAALGVARAAGLPPDLGQLVLRIQRELFVVAADLACNPRHRPRLEPRISLVIPEMVQELESAIDAVIARQRLRAVFVVPGANPASAALDVARTVVRRAERRAVQARKEGAMVADEVIAYLNRASDLVYVMARWAAGDREEPASHE